MKWSGCTPGNEEWEAGPGSRVQGSGFRRQFGLRPPGHGLRDAGNMVAGRMVVSLALLFAGATVAFAAEPSLSSAWRTDTITVDGVPNDWSAFTTLSEKPPISIAIANDGEFVYLALRTSDPGTRMMIERQGLFVWLDSSGKNKKTFGLRYPETPLGFGGRRGGFGRGGQGWPGSRPGEQETEPPEGAAAPDQADEGRLSHVLIIGPGKHDERSLMMRFSKGVEARYEEDEGTLTYEIKVPLEVTDAHPYAVGVVPGATLALGLESPKIQMPRVGGRHGGFGGFGGMGGRGGMGGGERGEGGERGGQGGERGRGFERPSPIKLWALVTLAGAPAR